MNPAPVFGGVAARCVSKIELRIECKDLLRADVTSKSDPCAILFIKNKSKWEEIDKTEKIQNTECPKFSKAISVDYYFEEVQDVRILLVDIDGEYTPDLHDDYCLGYLECTLGQIISGSPFIKKLTLKDGNLELHSTITVRSEEVKNSNEYALMKFNAAKLDNKDFMGKSDPYLEMLRESSDGNWQVIHRTEVVKDSLDPDWRPFAVPLHAMCGGDRSKPIMINIYDYDKDGSHDIIGGLKTSLQEMIGTGDAQVQWPCINEKKKAKKKNYKDSGKVFLSSCQIKKEYSFLDYIYGGTQINMTVGIDFTASNGDPSDPTSLHFMNPIQPNEYIQAIQAVGGVLQDYDSDKLFPVLGFGAELPATSSVSHEFAVNFNPQNPFCAGVDGIVAAYQNCIRQVVLYGPTNVAPIINHVAKFAHQAVQEESVKGAGSYCILLLLTDGALSDMGDTIQAIVKASALPMSIIIVGVGNADFTSMNQLDGDNGVLKTIHGEAVHRDIVQFVPFRQFAQVTASLARHVLAEVPKQLTGYFKMKNLSPNKMPQ